MKKKPIIKIYKTPEELATEFAKNLSNMINSLLVHQEKIHISLSGGRTPRYIFTHLAKEYADEINWNKIHLYWGDERCVPADHIDSNYGMTKTHLLDKINIPERNIHFIDGNEEPFAETARYGEVISSLVPKKDGIPRFDLVMLGMGEDGHTASIFPNNMDLLTTGRNCEVSEHPLSG